MYLGLISVLYLACSKKALEHNGVQLEEGHVLSVTLPPPSRASQAGSQDEFRMPQALPHAAKRHTAH